MRIEETLVEAVEAPGRPGLRPRWLPAVLVLLALGGASGDADVGGRPLPSLVGVDTLHDRGMTGRGVTIAVIGGGAASGSEILRAADGHHRLLAVFDADSGAVLEVPPAPEVGAAGDAPSRLLEAMLSSRVVEGGYEGIAPNADLVLVRAFGPAGAGSPTAVARGIAWVVANRERYGVRVLTLPIAAPIEGGPGEDELGRAVIDARAAGVVVVAAAGNGGPAPTTVAVPGDLPEVITVGAAAVSAEGVLVPGYSAAGPTLGGFVKPEVLAPTRQAEAASPAAAGGKVRRLSTGTGVASAVLSGVVALVLESSPWLTPGEVKLRLVLSARPVLAPAGPAYSALRQGAGLIDAVAAVAGPAVLGTERGRPGRDVAWSGGMAEDLVWSDSAGRGITWSDSAARGITWSDAAVRGMTWSDLDARGMTWSDGALRLIDGSDIAGRGLVWSD